MPTVTSGKTLTRVLRATTLATLLGSTIASAAASEKPRFREIFGAIGALPTGPHNAITDVSGVKVGQVTLISGDDVRTGVTAVIPHGGNLYQNKTPAAFFRANGYGKFAGSTQIDELGEIETPVILTNTLNVAEGISGVVDWTLKQPGNESVRSVNAVVGETNDGYLNNIRKRSLSSRDVISAIESADATLPDEGNVGAGTGTRAFGYKAGIGSSSRKLEISGSDYTLGVLVQANFGGRLLLPGLAAGDALTSPQGATQRSGDGSIIIVVATDAPLSDHSLQRLARRAILGLARTGSSMSNGSGDYVLAFSNAAQNLRTAEKRQTLSPYQYLPNEQLTPLFVAVADATQEAIYNSLFKAETLSGNGHTLEALPVARLRERRHLQ
jgi:D-aminopeptidase